MVISVTSLVAFTGPISRQSRRLSACTQAQPRLRHSNRPTQSSSSNLDLKLHRWKDSRLRDRSRTGLGCSLREAKSAGR